MPSRAGKWDQAPLTLLHPVERKVMAYTTGAPSLHTENDRGPRLPMAPGVLATRTLDKQHFYSDDERRFAVLIDRHTPEVKVWLKSGPRV